MDEPVKEHVVNGDARLKHPRHARQGPRVLDVHALPAPEARDVHQHVHLGRVLHRSVALAQVQQVRMLLLARICCGVPVHDVRQTALAAVEHEAVEEHFGD